MGGRSSSSSSSTQTTTNKTLNASSGDVENGAVVMNSGDNATITTTDYGAVNVARDIAFESLEISAKSLEELANSNIRSTAAIQDIAKTSQTGGQTLIADSLVQVFRPFALALLALCVVVVLVLLFKKKGAK
jgi:hypothetical protein